MVGSMPTEMLSGNRQLTFPVRHQNGTTGLPTCGTTGSGIEPSCPTRNTLAAWLALLGSHPAPPRPVELQGGALALIVCEKPAASEGISTLCTVFSRSYSRANPPRMTVLRSPISLPRTPPFSDGFQARDVRGAMLPQSMSKSGRCALLIGRKPKIGL